MQVKTLDGVTSLSYDEKEQIKGQIENFFAQPKNVLRFKNLQEK